VRAVHLGLGSFFRAHQAWYTDLAEDGWGIAAFAGRSRDLADRLSAQDGLYTVVTRRPDGDEHAVVGSVSRAYAAADHGAWLAHLASPDVAVLTLTVTEAGYRQGGDGDLDLDDAAVAADVAALRTDARASVTTVPGRLVAGLLARRTAGAGPLAVVPCDNLPDNGEVVRRVVHGAGAAVDPSLPAWLDEAVTWVSTVVDRITPATTGADVDGVREATGRADAAPVVTEPFSEWLLAGAFPAGRPDWPSAGARVVDDVAPFERRKLWLLNGAHSLLAYAGPLRGHQTVAEAMADESCRGWVEQWWGEACRHLDMPGSELNGYRASLVDRFENPRVRHLLGQIAGEGTQKLPVRLLPALRAERAAGRPHEGATRALAAWVLHLRGDDVTDSALPGTELQRLRTTSLHDATARALATLGNDLGDLVPSVAAAATELSASRSVRR